MEQYHQHKKNHFGQDLLKGALAGFIATIPMTLFMQITQQFLPKGQRYALPPEIIIQELTQRAHVRKKMNKFQILESTFVSHFGYGTTMGLLYGRSGKKGPLSSVVKGILFGLLVWAGNYLALLPLFGMRASGQKEPMPRNFMMIAAHIVWGSTLGLVANMLQFNKNGE